MYYLCLGHFSVEGEVDEMENTSEDQVFAQIYGDIVVDIQYYETPWRENLPFLNKG